MLSTHQATLNAGVPLSSPCLPNQRIIDTGITGVQVNIETRKEGDRVRVTVRQRVQSGQVKVLVGSRSLRLLTQAWLDRTLCEAAALKWHCKNVELFGIPKNPIRIADLPRQIIPTSPTKRVALSDVVAINRGSK